MTGGAPSCLQVRDTVDIDAARRSYYTNLFPLNPGGIVPGGPTARELQLEKEPGQGRAQAALAQPAFFLRGGSA